MNNSVGHIEVNLPDQKNFDAAYNLALKLASEKLALNSAIKELCRRSGSIFIDDNSRKSIGITYLSNQYVIELPDIDIIQLANPQSVDIKDKILILHYLLTSSGKPLSGNLISFKELGEGMAYFPTFFQRAIQPLITHFGTEPETILTAAAPLQPFKSAFGDFALTITAFPKLSITLVLWKGDEEFPPDANILFDRLVLDYLPLEDLIVLCQTIVWKIIKSHKL